MSWTIKLSSHAEKQLLKLAKPVRARIIGRLRELEALPAPSFHKDVLPLTGELRGFLRYRVGDFRIILRKVEDKDVIAVVGIYPRGDAYKKA